MKKNSQVTDIESPFEYPELFYSKTDLRGVILSGNSVFRRVSEYAWDELLEKPHSLIRHPEMPRGVFCLFWQFLKAGRPIGAFVKNRSKTGKYYWVFALALPVDDGYLSVRLKPGSTLLKTIEAEYRELREFERTQNPSPEVSADRLKRRLAELGFANYESFMSYALVDQILNRDRELQKIDHSDVGRLLQMKELSHGIVQDTGQILKAFLSSQYVPLNLEVYASKLGGEGRQVSVVASQYQDISRAVAEKIEDFEAKAGGVSAQIGESQFLVGAAQLLRESASYLKTESGDQDPAQLRLICDLAQTYLEKAREDIRQLHKVVRDFDQTCRALSMSGMGLELVRVTGQIELARIPQSSEGSALLGSLQHFQESLKQGLERILDRNDLIDEAVKNLLASVARPTQEA